MSDLSNQPKTLDDYRDIVKILKLKVIKQMKKIQQLQQKVRTYESQQSKFKISQIEHTNPIGQAQNLQKDFDYSNLKNKSIVMYLYQKGAEKLGLNLEGIFRYADTDYSNQIDSDQFRIILSKLNLGLTLKQISCLIFIFDQNCTGIIKKTDYFNSLQAFQVSRESKNKHYTQQCLMRLSELFQKGKVDLNQFYEQMSKRQDKVDSNVFEDFIKKRFNNLIQQRQIIGAFNQIDFQSQGHIQKNNFIYSLRSYISKVKNQNQNKNQNKSNDNNKIIANDNSKSQLKQNTKLPSDSRVSNNQKVLDSSNKAETSSKNHYTKISTTELLDYFKNNGIQIDQIYQNILHLNFQKNITLNKFLKVIRSISSELQTEKISQLFYYIDKHKKGSIYLNELLRFYLQNSTDIKIVLKLISRYFIINKINASQYFAMFELSQSSSINKKKFMEVFTSNFKLESQLLEGLWKYFDKQNRDNVKVEMLVKQLQENDSS